MPRILSNKQILDFREQGFCSPIRIADSKTAQNALASILRHSQLSPTELNEVTSPHLQFPEIGNFVYCDRILAIFVDLFGAAYKCVGAQFFNKMRNSEEFVSWHQDGVYWGLHSLHSITLWMAFSKTDTANGCLQVCRNSPTEIIPHSEYKSDNNLVSRGQVISRDIENTDIIALNLDPGEASLHSSTVIHGSLPNKSESDRLGIAIRYVPAKTN